MKRNLITIFILFIPLLIVQVTLIPLISIEYFSPDLILILLVYFTLIEGQLTGTIIGAVFGLVFDLVSGGLLGVTMFSKTIAGFTTGYFYSENKIDKNTGTLNFALILFTAAVVDSFFSGLLSGAEELNIFTLIISRTLFPAIYTTIIGVIVVLVIPKRKFV